MANDKDSVVSAQSPKLRRGRNREVSSRFQSLTSATSLETGIAPSAEAISPIRRKNGSPSTDTRKHRSLDDPCFIRGPQLWPSASSVASSVKTNAGTLADHLGDDRFRDYLDRKTNEKSAKDSSIFSLSRQRSGRELPRSENDQDNSKENHRPIIGGSMRHMGKLGFTGKSSPSSSSLSVKPDSNDSGIAPGRLSVDENALHRKSFSSRRNPLTGSVDSESGYTDASSSMGFSSPATGRDLVSTRKLGIEVPSKYMSDVSTASRRLSMDTTAPKSLSSDNSSMLKKFTIKNAIKRANSLTGYKSSKSQWALSPGRSASPPMSVESKEKPTSFSSLKPPTSPSKAKVVEKILNIGFDFFKSKKTSMISTPTGSGNLDALHRLRLLDNRLIQWRYANARAEAINKSTSNQAESNSLCAFDGIHKLRYSVRQKKLQYEKEKLQMKLNFILYSQIKLLEAWGNLERQHVSAITVTKECLHSVVCRVPLIEGAKVDIPSASIALRHASELAASITSILTSFSSSANKTAALISELALVVTQEKLLLEEFNDLFHIFSVLEIQERSLKCSLIQFDHWQQQYQQQQLLPEISS
ncbi:hypothetical protein L6164_022298 [Bauhinia variegata]|uniref:Uncharacterized protein n=1 Tax=Bauhinia variegata TaxID=167791 RepID=A0ACB9MHK7_BAUVA|nr:hypothetical protein L6164_022298 [Bauhinia variegata]